MEQRITKVIQHDIHIIDDMELQLYMAEDLAPQNKSRIAEWSMQGGLLSFAEVEERSEKTKMLATTKKMFMK